MIMLVSSKRYGIIANIERYDFTQLLILLLNFLRKGALRMPQIFRMETLWRTMYEELTAQRPKKEEMSSL